MSYFNFPDPFHIPDPQNSQNPRQTTPQNDSQDDLAERTSSASETNLRVLSSNQAASQRPTSRRAAYRQGGANSSSPQSRMSPRILENPQSQNRVLEGFKRAAEGLIKQVDEAPSLIYFDDKLNGYVSVEEVPLQEEGKAKFLNLKRLEKEIRETLQAILERDETLKEDSSWCCSGSNSTQRQEIQNLSCFNIPSDLPLNVDGYIKDLSALKERDPDGRIKMLSEGAIIAFEDLQATAKDLKKITKRFLLEELKKDYNALHG